MTEIEAFYPTSLKEALILKEEMKNSHLLAGGVSFLRTSQENPQSIISLAQVKELKKMSFFPTFIEIGTMVSLKSILKIGVKRPIPSLLLQAIDNFCYYPILSQVTLGGNLCYYKRNDLLSVLGLLKAKLEVKSGKKTYWINLSKYINSNKVLNLKKTEIATKVRIPLIPYWTKEVYKKIIIPYSKGNEEITVSLLFKTRNEVIEKIILLFDAEEEIFFLNEKDLGIERSFLPLSLDQREYCLRVSQKTLKQKSLSKLKKEGLFLLMQWSIDSLRI